MTPAEIYQQARSYGLELKQKGEQLLVYGQRCPPEFVETLQQYKPALLDWLSKPSCPGWCTVPPDSLPLNYAIPTPKAENRERTISYLLRQAPCPGPLAEWLLKRENAYYDGPGRKWDCSLLAYAVARDAACWQLNRNEAEVSELLTVFCEAR